MKDFPPESLHQKYGCALYTAKYGICTGKTNKKFLLHSLYCSDLEQNPQYLQQGVSVSATGDPKVWQP